MIMNFNRAKHYYQKTENSVNAVKDPTEIVKTMIQELNKSMNLVVSCMKENKDPMVKSKNFSKSLMIIYTLQTTLDFEKGGDLATQLFQIYEYCRQQLIKGFSKSIPEIIIKSINSLNEIFFGGQDGKPAKA